MPELAEVEFYRQQWDCGLGDKICAIKLHPRKRVFGGTDPKALHQALPGAILITSAAHGKRMLFRFSNHFWLGLHLGMTGELRVEGPAFRPGKHDHLVLYQPQRALVFADMRQFGRIRWHQGASPPEWWTCLPAPLTSKHFTAAGMGKFLQRHGKLPIKATLLLQAGFPGIGNWMADEILWRAKINPRAPTGQINGSTLKRLWRTIRFVCRQAIRHVGQNSSDPPRGWFYHERWEGTGRCPQDGGGLIRETIGGRTTAWCPQCQGQVAK